MPESDNLAIERGLLIEAMQRYQSALTRLHANLDQRERATGLARLSFSRAWDEGVTEFNALGDWLDQEIDRRVPYFTGGSSDGA